MFSDGKIRNITLAQFVGVAFALIFFIASCVVASYDCGLKIGCANKAISVIGITNGEGFMIVGFALAFFAYLGSGIYYLNRQLGKVVYGFYTATTAYMILASLVMAVWAGAKLNTLDDQAHTGGIALALATNLVSSLKAMIAGASLLLITMVALLALLVLYKPQLSEQDSIEAAADPNAAYSASYQNYEVPAGTVNPYEQHSDSTAM